MSRDHHPRGPFVPLQRCTLAGKQQAATTGHSTGFPVCRKQVCFLLSFWLYSQLNSNQHFFKNLERGKASCVSAWEILGANGAHMPGATAGCCWPEPGGVCCWTTVGHRRDPLGTGSLHLGHPLLQPCGSEIPANWLNHHYFCPDKIPIRKKGAQDV